MQARVALVLEIGVAQLVRVVPNDALDQRQVVEEDGTAQTPRYVNPDTISEEWRYISVRIHGHGRVS
jgi:hypothetical protein